MSTKKKAAPKPEPVAAVAVAEPPKIYDPTDPSIPGSPAYLQEVAKDAWDRNHPTERPSAPTMKRWLVSYGGSWTETVSARTRDDAWAMACDKKKRWPNPRSPGIDIQQV